MVSILYTTMADDIGFEPMKDFSLPVFKTGALNHSANHP